MQFSVVALLVAFAASVSAVPTTVHFNRGACAAVGTYHCCSTYPVDGVDDSPLIACAAALGPTAASCVSAAVQESVGMCCFSISRSLLLTLWTVQ